MVFFVVVGFFVLVVLIGGNCRVGVGELFLDLVLLEEVLVELEKRIKGYNRRFDVNVGKVFLRENLVVLFVLVLKIDVNGIVNSFVD